MAELEGDFDSLASVAYALMPAKSARGSSRSANHSPGDDASGQGTPTRYRRRLSPDQSQEQQEAMASAGVPRKRLDRALSKRDTQLDVLMPTVPVVATSAHKIVTAGGGKKRKVHYKSTVSYPAHEADEHIGGDSGNESDLEEDDAFWSEVREKSKGMMMCKAAKQTTRLERRFRKFDESWDKVLLDLTKNGEDVKDGRDLKFSLSFLLNTQSASVDTTDSFGDTALHCAARSGRLEAVDMLMQHGAKTTARNHAKQTPLLLALRSGHDCVAARIMAAMRPVKVRDVFLAHGEEDCAFSFHKLVENAEMKESLTAALDAMVKKLHNTPNNFVFFMQILDGDEYGRSPHDDRFSGKRTALQLIAKTGNKTAVYHNVVRILLWHKWKKFVSVKYWMQAAVFTLYVIGMTVALILAATVNDPTRYSSPKDMIRAVCEVLSVIFCMYGLVAEANQLHKHRMEYFEDLYNYADVPAFSLLLVVIPLRFTHAPAQWTVASFAYLATCLRFFRYTCAFRNIGAYTQILGRIVRNDIFRFMIIFCIFLVTFSGSFFLALRGEERFSTSQNGTVSDLDLFFSTGSYPEILLSGLRIMIESGSPINFYSQETKLGWLGVLLILVFMFFVIVVLLNILIAQLSDTYQNVQNDAQREVELNRAYIVGRIEKNSLLYKNLLATHYQPYVRVLDPVNVLERWECPPLNVLHRQLHSISTRLELYESSMLTMENSQSNQTRVLETLRMTCEDQSKLIMKLLRKLKKEKKSRKSHPDSASGGAGKHSDHSCSKSSTDSSSSSDRGGTGVAGALSAARRDSWVEDDETGGGVRGAGRTAAMSTSPTARSDTGIRYGLLQSGGMAATALMPAPEHNVTLLHLPGSHTQPLSGDVAQAPRARAYSDCTNQSKSRKRQQNRAAAVSSHSGRGKREQLRRHSALSRAGAISQDVNDNGRERRRSGELQGGAGAPNVHVIAASMSQDAEESETMV